MKKLVIAKAEDMKLMQEAMQQDPNQHQVDWKQRKNRFAMNFWQRIKQVTDGEAGTDAMTKLWEDLVEVGDALDTCADMDDFDSCEGAKIIASETLAKFEFTPKGWK